jgi:hypothetical protein
MIILDGAPISIPIWQWFCHKVPVVESLPPSIPAVVFKHLVKDPRRAGDEDEDEEDTEPWPQDYLKLDLGQFWEVFTAVTQVVTNMRPDGAPPHLPTEDVAGELERIVAVAARWALLEDLPADSLGDFDRVEWDGERGRLRQTARYKIYYMAQLVEDAAATLRRLGWEPRASRRGHGRGEGKDFMEGLIREKSKGDLDEFILYTIQYMQFKTITPHHNKLAQLVRWKAFGDSVGEDLLPPQEIWRLLYPNFFDGVEDYFDKFFDKFTNECILYFLVDYLSYDYNIKLVPVYNIYTADDGKTFSPNVANLVDRGRIEKDIKRIEAQFKWT